MKLLEPQPGIYVIVTEEKTYRVAPVSVHNFRIERAVMELRGPKKRPYKVGLLKNPGSDGQAIVEAVLQAEREFDQMLAEMPEHFRRGIKGRGWVKDMDEPA